MFHYLRRGQHEGEELDKILFFYPADMLFSAQLSVIGLSEGLITFTRKISPEAACEVIEAEMHSHVFYEAEPDIWIVLRSGEFRRILKEVHSLFMMFHGSTRALLDKEPSGGLVRKLLYSFVMDYLDGKALYSKMYFLIGKKIQLPNFRNTLKERGTVQMLTVSREAAMEVQFLVSKLILLVCAVACQTLRVVFGECILPLILFQDLLVSTTLSPDDTVNLYTYAILRLSPAFSSGSSTWSYLRKGKAASHTTGAVSMLANAGSGLDQSHGSRDSHPAGDNNHDITRPLQPNKWARERTHASSMASANRGLEEKMYILAYQHKSLTLILLIPLMFIMDGEQGISMVKQQVLENASAKIFKVEEKLSKGWAGENAYHVGGYRTCWLMKYALEQKNNAWVIARVTRGKELYMVLEKANETLLYASDAVEKFSNKYCNGAFSFE
ncbi:hypothetical protein DCAR_0726996 [Daucus carota subsp. sativus]|uniref:CCZ1/INTU/HSP4 first Longin domain-containing protein n=1 Tax=Daucus carota subsp. sativus TaxID=79200 RepID=A0AAF1B5P5_DAUCS|nr:hypothetical protein DCAR_0726996 [Daucus carota subsp. sativus]